MPRTASPTARTRSTDTGKTETTTRLRVRGGNDLLKGGGGADHLDGDDGIDTAAYGDFPKGVIVYLWSGYAGGGDAEGDTLVDIEICRARIMTIFSTATAAVTC